MSARFKEKMDKKGYTNHYYYKLTSSIITHVLPSPARIKLGMTATMFGHLIFIIMLFHLYVPNLAIECYLTRGELRTRENE